jgi:hypothetical protein
MAKARSIPLVIKATLHHQLCNRNSKEACDEEAPHFNHVQWTPDKMAI